MLDDRLRASPQQFLKDLRILLKLQPQSSPHHILLDLTPICPQWLRPLIASIECLIRCWGLNDIHLLSLALKFLGLEVVLIGLIGESIVGEGRRVDVVELAVWIFRAVEVYDLFGLVLHLDYEEVKDFNLDIRDALIRIGWGFMPR